MRLTDNILRRALATVLAVVTSFMFVAARDALNPTDSVAARDALNPTDSVAARDAFNPTDSIADAPATAVTSVDSVFVAQNDTVEWKLPEGPFDSYNTWFERDVEFNPSPNRAVWMSALFPGLGQIYNRRYWKLPLVVGGYLGLAYATSWNNGMLNDYSRAYRDIMDKDPTTDSYMDFFPPTTSESDLDRQWLTNLLKSRKDFYRRNRDLCIIGMVAVYFLAMVDAYVDASLSHFDITPELSMDITPAIIPDTRGRLPGAGFSWAVNF